MKNTVTIASDTGLQRVRCVLAMNDVDGSRADVVVVDGEVVASAREEFIVLLAESFFMSKGTLFSLNEESGLSVPPS